MTGFDYQVYDPRRRCWHYHRADNNPLIEESGSHYLPGVPVRNPPGWRCPCPRGDTYPPGCRNCHDYNRPVTDPAEFDGLNAVAEAERLVREGYRN
ncbi:MAG: hypothetical protein HYY29_04965 [Chloroflexi bacterium]|nr:hypothetical protein [Chloroflexota bacterium]